jgi:hypothetical protein
MGHAALCTPSVLCDFTVTPPMQTVVVLVWRKPRHYPELPGSRKCCFRGGNKWARVRGRRIATPSLESLCSAPG